MNQIAIAVKMNERQMLIGARWPTIATLKTRAIHKLTSLKRTINEAALNAAMAIIPVPQCAAA